MDCRRIDLILDNHGVATLDAAERSEIDSHVASCGRCSDARLSHETLAAESPDSPRSGLLAETLDRAVGGVGPKSIAAGGRRAAMLGLAAAVLAAMALAALLSPAQRPVTRAGSPDPAAPAMSSQPKGISTPPVATAGPYVDGRQYRALAVPVATDAGPDRVEVYEFFTFGCIHCFDFEPALAAWSAVRPEYVDFVRVPVIFNATARLQAQAFYTAEVLGRLDSLIAPFFEEIHVRGEGLATVGAIREFFGRHGVHAESFDEAFESVGVATRMRRAVDLNRRYGVDATPSMGVNGKYLTTGSMAGSNEAMLDVVDALVKSEAEAMCAARSPSRCPSH